MNATTAAESAALAPSFQDLPLAKIHAGINPRTVFDDAALTQLRDSIAAQGVMQPILVRPHPSKEGEWQIVAGERRVRASRLASRETVPAIVRTLDDTAALKLALTENLQRADLHELEEAEGYDALMKPPHSLTAENLAKEVGKSLSYVHGRLRLLALGQAGRIAFLGGKIDSSRALLIARVPTEDLQVKALNLATEIPQWSDEPRPYRRLHEELRGKFMTPLQGMGWSTKDASLVPEIGACTTCKHNTANARDLFDDVKAGADVCTNPPCFRAKGAAHAKVLSAKAKAEGRKVIEGKEAKAILPNGPASGVGHQSGYKKLDQTEWVGSKSVKVADLVKKERLETALVVVDGAAVEVVSDKALRAAMKSAGLVEKRDGRPKLSPAQAAKERETKAKVAIENTARRIAWHKARESILTGYDKPVMDASTMVSVRIDVLATFALRAFKDLMEYGDADERILRLWEERITPPAGAESGTAAADRAKGKGKTALPTESEKQAHLVRMLELAIPKLSPPELLMLMADCMVVDRMEASQYARDVTDAGSLASFCELLGIDLAKERAEALAQWKADEKAKAAPAKKAKTPPPRPVAFYDPATGSTWSGRGVPPKWIIEAEANGRKREEFASKGAVKPTSTTEGASA